MADNDHGASVSAPAVRTPEQEAGRIAEAFDFLRPRRALGNLRTVIDGIVPEITWPLVLLVFVVGVLLPAVWGSARRRRAALKVLTTLSEIVEALASATRRRGRTELPGPATQRPRRAAASVLPDDVPACSDLMRRTLRTYATHVNQGR